MFSVYEHMETFFLIKWGNNGETIFIWTAFKSNFEAAIWSWSILYQKQSEILE